MWPSSRSAEKPANMHVTSLAANHVHFNVQNLTVDSTAWSREPILIRFSDQRAIDSDNAITKDRPRLKRTTKLNVTIVLLHSTFQQNTNISCINESKLY